MGELHQNVVPVPGGVIEPVTSTTERLTTTEHMMEKTTGAMEVTDGLKPGYSQANVTKDSNSGSKTEGFIAAYLLFVIFCMF
jgi:hypothetical protein